jgi:transcriptional regulator with AAA-type ATPase domain
MLGLVLRQEFQNKRLKGTAIELSNEAKTGATQIAAQDFLQITYPTHDVLKGIEAVGPGQGRPVVVIGERGLGKSHLLAALYHKVYQHLSLESVDSAYQNAVRSVGI